MSMSLYQGIQHVPVSIHCMPQRMVYAMHGEKHLIQMPFGARPGTSTTEPMGILWLDLQTPLLDRFIGHDNPMSIQQLLNIALAGAAAEVHPDAMAYDLHGKWSFP